MTLTQGIRRKKGKKKQKNKKRPVVTYLHSSSAMEKKAAMSLMSRAPYGETFESAIRSKKLYSF